MITLIARVSTMAIIRLNRLLLAAGAGDDICSGPHVVP